MPFNDRDGWDPVPFADRARPQTMQPCRRKHSSAVRCAVLRRTHRRARRRCHRGSRERERRRIPVQPRALRRAGPPVPPGSWLAAIGWRRLGLVDPGEAPAAGREVT